MSKQTDLDLILKLRTVNISRRGLFAASAAAALSARQGFEAAAQDSPQVIYDGSVYDSGGMTLRVANWGGFWEELQRKYLVEPFEKDFNCKIEYDNAWPWFPKFVAGGVDNAPFDVSNWNLPDLFKTARAGAADGGYFVPIEEMKANIPNTQELYEFAYRNGHGITYLVSQYGYAYRTDVLSEPPADFKTFWEDRFADKRATYITSNTLQMCFFILSCLVYGNDDESNIDIAVGVDAMKRAMPMKISDFTGNMQTLLERGEVDICVQIDNEPYAQAEKGLPVGFKYWTERAPILTQTNTISRGISDDQKRLAYAYVNRACSKEYQEAFAKDVFMRPSNKNAGLSQKLIDLGVSNGPEVMDQLWIPPWDWYLDHEDEIVEQVNEIFGM